MATEVKRPCSAVAVRYVHDVRTGEFLNIGTILMSPAFNFVGARFIQSWARVTAAFPDADPVLLRRLARLVDRACDEWVASTRQLEFHRVDDLTLFLRGVIGVDDASITFSPIIAGITSDPAATLGELFFLYAAKHATPEPKPSRDEADIWRAFVQQLATPEILVRLEPFVLSASHYSYRFEHTWMNGLRNAAQPLSLDMVDPRSIREKATHWTGRLIYARPSQHDMRVHFLVGMPPETAPKSVLHAASDAFAILEDSLAGEASLVTEDREAEFADQIATDLRAHSAGESTD